MSPIKPLFIQSSSITIRALVLGGIALALVLVGSFTTWLDPIKAKLGAVSAPFYWLVDAPSDVGDWAEERLQSREELAAERDALQAELLIVKRKLQQMASLYAENVRLQELMNASESVQERVLVGELIGISPDPLTHKIVVNRGTNHQVYVGQPVLDATGLMGQVVEVGPFTSQVLLITDTTHALPVQVNRNGVRAVAEGVGDLYQLVLRHVSNSTDIKEGDLLVSSGLGQRFPVGYPVATVEKITYDPGQPFAEVIARPMANLNRSRHVLLVFSETKDTVARP